MDHTCKFLALSILHDSRNAVTLNVFTYQFWHVLTHAQFQIFDISPINNF